jgi:hypothetical protein
MSKSNYYQNHYSPKKKVKEIPLTKEMKDLIPTISKVKINEERDMLSIYDGNPKHPIRANYDVNNAPATVSGLVEKLVKEFKYNQKIALQWSNLLSEELVKLEEEDLEDDGGGEENQRKIVCLHKYSTDIPLAEAILIGNKPMFLQIIDGKVELSKEIPLPDSNIVLQPLDKWSYQSKEYSFASEEEINSYIGRAKQETLDTLYKKVKSIWEKYIDAEDFHIIICAADTIFTYFQDRFGMTHYLLFVGDNDVGKTNNIMVLQQLAYRALYSISLTAAGIYRSQGGVEEGQVTILEDEIDNIDKQDEKMRIYKAGYKAGVKVQRNDDTPSGRKAQGYFPYGFKAFTSEKQPDSTDAKGFNERTFVIKCSVGGPEYDISEIVTPAGDEDYVAQLDELTDMRKLLLVYRLLHHNEPIPNIKLNLKNRDNQLCKPLLRLFQGTKASDEISKTLLRLLKEKKNRKSNTIEAVLYNIVKVLVAEAKPQQASLNEDEVVLTSVDIWTRFKADVKGGIMPQKPQTYDTTDYGPVSQRQLASIIEDRFGGDNDKDSKSGLKIFRFNKKKLEKVGTNYTFIDKINITRITPKAGSDVTGPSRPSRPSTKGGTYSETQKAPESGNNYNTGCENTQESGGKVADITKETDVKTSEHSHNAPEGLEGPVSSFRENPPSATVSDAAMDGNMKKDADEEPPPRSSVASEPSPIEGSENTQLERPTAAAIATAIAPIKKHDEQGLTNEQDKIDNGKGLDTKKTDVESTTPVAPKAAQPPIGVKPPTEASVPPAIPPEAASTGTEAPAPPKTTSSVPAQTPPVQPTETGGVKTPRPRDEEIKLPKLPDMSKEPEDYTPVVTEEELQYLQESSKSKKPRISVEDFFNNDILLLDGHSLEESPAAPIIGSRPGEIPGDIAYFCKVHPDLGSTHLTAIEIHCQKELDVHKAAILAEEARRGESA